MKKISKLRDTRGMPCLKGLPITQQDVASYNVPPHTVRNLRQGHYIKGIRDINRIDREEWELNVAEMLRKVEKKRLNLNNRFYYAMDRISKLLVEVFGREERLQKTTEELEANYEELQATNEEMKDTTEELRATSQELERISSYRETLMNSMLDMLMTTDPSGIITDVNRTAEEISGYSRDELIGKPFRRFFKDAESAQAGIEAVLTDRMVTNYELTLVTENGEERQVSYNASVLSDTGGRAIGVLGIARDISGLKQMEQQRARVDKMTALGTLIAGVAHELINPLTSILNFIQYCLTDTPEDDKRHAVLQDAEHETRRSIEIVHGLLTYSRVSKDKEEYRKGHLETILANVFKTLSHDVEEGNVSITRHTAEDVPAIWMNVNSMQQVFTNIIANALAAVKESEGKEIQIDITREGEFVQVKVTDSGCGITAKDLEKIFDPFFTTQPTGQGIGLGLSISQSIIRDHGGEIACESEVGVRTTFKILLPIEKRME